MHGKKSEGNRNSGRGRPGQYRASNAMPSSDFTYHPAAELLPLDSAAVAALTASIERHGLKQPIVVERGTRRIVDGRHRAVAAAAAGQPITPEMLIEVDGDDAALLNLALAGNLDRRHLSTSSRAALGALLSDPPATLEVTPVTQAEAAARTGVAERSVASALKVKRADPTLFAAVLSESVAVSAAVKLLAAPEAVRHQLCETLAASPATPRSEKRALARQALAEAKQKQQAPATTEHARLVTMLALPELPTALNELAEHLARAPVDDTERRRLVRGVRRLLEELDGGERQMRLLESLRRTARVALDKLTPALAAPSAAPSAAPADAPVAA